MRRFIILSLKRREGEVFEMKRILCVLLALCMIVPAVVISAAGDDLKIIDAVGGFEVIGVEWTNTAAASGYNVYVKKTTDSAYPEKPIDKQLIRYYGSYYRADALGLAAGEYDVKVETADKSASAERKNITVLAHKREGFAFSQNSPAKTASGGYNEDGTVPDDAVIVYVTNENVNTVKATINKKEYTGLCKILDGIGSFSRPEGPRGHYIIRIIGKIDGDNVIFDGNSVNKPDEPRNNFAVQRNANVTIEGVGNDATLYKCGILMKRSQNIEVRNLGVMLFLDDGISSENSSSNTNTNLWIHNNDLYYGTSGTEADKVKGDGGIDLKANTKYVTVSYNHLHDNGKTSLVQPTIDGVNGDGTDFLTYHHNWFDHSDSRHPRIRYSTVHVYNNYYDGNANYGVGVTSGASAFVEANVFRAVRMPMISANQGHDLNEDGESSTLSGEAGGIIKAFNNKFEDNCGEVSYYGEGSDFDAYKANSRDEKVPADVKTKVDTAEKTGEEKFKNTYNNFDTDSSAMYNYTPDDPDKVVADVTKYAGRFGGDDIDFDLSDYTPSPYNGEKAADNPDEDHFIIPELKAMLEKYQSSVVKNYVGSETEYPATSGTAPSPKPTDEPKPTSAPTPKPEFDYEIASASYADGKLAAELKYNGSDESPTAVLIVGTYSEGDVLTDAKTFEINGTEIKNLDFAEPQSGVTRLFVWSGTGDSKPLATPFEIE